MEISAITDALKAQSGNISPIGATLKFVLDEQIIYIDGSGETNEVTNEDKDADCVIISSVDTFIKLKSGDLNPMMAVMSGKVKIKGDMGVAMKLQSLI